MAALKDLINVNKILKKVVEKENKVTFSKVSRKKDLCVIGVSDASYNRKDHSVAEGLILLESRTTKVTSPMLWMSGVIRKTCTSP